MELSPYAETTGAIALACVGGALGFASSRLRKPYWALGYLVPLAAIVAICAARRLPGSELAREFGWLVSGRRPFAVLAFIAPMILTTPLSRLPRPRDRMWVLAFVVLTVLSSGVLPFFAPILNQTALAKTVTRMNRDGVCLQTTDYTCGPAAAVTALRKLGFRAEEGELAIWARTTTFTGTPPDILADVLREKYSPQGLAVEYRVFQSVRELPKDAITLVLVKFGLLVDHYVAALEVTDETVLVADPLSGLDKLPRKAFEGKWRFAGIVLRANSAGVRPGTKAREANQGESRSMRQAPSARVY